MKALFFGSMTAMAIGLSIFANGEIGCLPMLGIFLVTMPLAYIGFTRSDMSYK